MKKMMSMMSESARELRNLKNLTVCAMMAALAVALAFTTSIQVTQDIKIGFSGLPNQVVDCLFGPVAGAMFGGALDVIKYFVKPTGAYFPGFTLSGMVAGLIYGCFYYKKNPSFVRVLVASFLVNVVVNMGMNTCWLAIMYGYGGAKFLAVLKVRVIKNLIMTPVDALVFWVVMRPLGQVIKKALPGRLKTPGNVIWGMKYGA
jgi:ECF transporter S component (folate family)